MPQQVEFGTVKFYDSFGFISREGARAVFFLTKNFAWPEASEDGVRFVGNNSRMHRMNRLPQVGDNVAFTVAQGQRGPYADSWCYAEDYEAALKEFEHRPKPLRYRVVVVYDQTHLVGGTIDEPHVEWGGTSGGTLDELSDRYPRNRYDQLRYFSHDDFNRRSQIQVLEGDEWVDVVEDPRPEVSDNYRSRYR